jgi:hypothetical protein
MATEKPMNEKLWVMVVSQAKTKYTTYPSPGASHWVHQRYIELGGKFEKSTDHTARKAAMKKLWERKLAEKREAVAKRKDKK